MGKRHIIKSNADSRLALTQSAMSIRQWVVDKALPFWAENAVDDEGGFCEELLRNTKPNWNAVRRLRVQARQIYTYTMAQHLGWFDGLPIASQTLDFMLAKGFMPDDQAGFISLLNPDLSVKDARRDLYDHAFYLLALAWHARVSGRGNSSDNAGQTSLALANSILLFLDQNLAAGNGGYLEGLPEGDPRNALRRQNPHMHMFEALMALYDVDEEQKYLRRAGHIFELFKHHFFDEDTATITEYFHLDWRAARGPQGQSVEPGHMAEWVWLLGQFETKSGIDTRPWADKLYCKLCSYDTLLLPDEMDKNGNTVRATRRLWVQTEMIKAHLAQAEHGDGDSYRLAEAAIDMVCTKYLRPDGTWLDVLGENGLPVIGPIPTSSFYHIMGMAAETCRVAGVNMETKKEHQKSEKRS